MWCATCHQDVPHRAANGSIADRCSRCGSTFDDASSESPDFCAAYLNEGIPEAQTPEPAAAPLASSDFDNAALEQLLAGPPLPADDWKLEAQLRDVNRLVDRLRRTTPTEPIAAAVPRSSAVYEPLSPAPIPSAIARLQAVPSAPPASKAPVERSSLGAWLLISLGLAMFACGGVLLGWAFLADRGDLWSLGLPLTLAGQASLILGLVMQLEGLWRSTRQTDQTLSELDGQLHQLRHATTMLSATHSAPAQSFYVHMAEGASPQLLMADLKGQLDLLAQQLANQRRAA